MMKFLTPMILAVTSSSGSFSEDSAFTVEDSAGGAVDNSVQTFDESFPLLGQGDEIIHTQLENLRSAQVANSNGEDN